MPHPHRTSAPTNNYLWWLSAALFVVAAWFSEGHHQGDEHFQILEFAAYKLGLASAEDLTWEFQYRMRPALQPAIAYGVYHAVGLFSERADPFAVAFALRLLSAGFTLWILTGLWRRYGGGMGGNLARWLFLLLFFHWCALYNGVRFSGENWGGLFLVAGLLTYPLPRAEGFTPAGGRSAVGAGILFALAFLCRYQMAVGVVGFGGWLLFSIGRGRGMPWGNLIKCMGAGIITLGLAYPLSYWLYDEWTLPAWNYLYANLIEGRAASYGSRPWWAYLELVFLRGIPPLGLAYVIAFFVYLYAYRRDPISWTVGVFVVVHSLLARKDIRFLYPLIPLLPVLIVGSLSYLGEGAKRWTLFARLCWSVNLLLLAAVTLRPAAGEIAPMRFVYYRYPGGVKLTGPDAPMVRAREAVGRFYLRPNSVVASADTTSPGTGVRAPLLYVVQTREAPEPPPGSRLVYSDRPEWLLDRFDADPLKSVKWWYLYEVPVE